MIRTFKNKDTQAIYEGKRVKKWQAITSQAERRLEILDNAIVLDDLRSLNSSCFEALVGDRKGQYSIRINKQWRICFKWDHEPYDVEVVDYH